MSDSNSKIEIEIEIDGKKLQAQPNAMIIQVADEAGIYIPRFCYHKHLSIAANCRMCLVEVEKSPKTLPACATPVMPGMKIFTRSAKAIAAQKAVMEFLLINHPLDCPICDQGGECELQDLSMGYGATRSYYGEGKRTFKDKDIGPLISTDMTRCIECTRCVRFGSEVAGFRELGATGRGEHMEIGTYVQHAMQSEVSGNIIDLCPVGALTSKPFRFTARAWELQQYPSIAAHDCIGSHLHVHTRTGKVMRVVSHEDMAINQTWLSDRDRYSYEGLYHPDRLANPMIRVGDAWQETNWQAALEFAVQGLQRVLNQHGAEQVAALASPNSTLEEFYLLQKLLRGVGSSNIDHRLRQVDFRDQDYAPAYPGLNMSITDLDLCDVILLIGSNIQKEQPVASLRIRKAGLNGTKICAVNMVDYDFHFAVAAKKIVAPHEMLNALREIVEEKNNIKTILNSGKKIAILIGASGLNHPEASEIRALANTIAEQTGATVGFLTEGANAAGAWLAGAIPHRSASGKNKDAGLNAQTIWEEARKAYLLLNVEPDLDCANPVAAIRALDHAEFVVALTSFKNPVLEQFANVMLPIAPFTETSGTFVNAEGRWQSFKGVANAVGESRPAWKVLRVLGNFLHCDGFEYESSEAVREEVRGVVDEMLLSLSHNGRGEEAGDRPVAPTSSRVDFSMERGGKGVNLTRIGDIPIYSGDSLTRRAKALQATQPIIEGNLNVVRLNPRTAEKLQLKETESVFVKQHEMRTRLSVVFDARVPDNAALIAGALPMMSGFSQLFGAVEIQKV